VNAGGVSSLPSQPSLMPVCSILLGTRTCIASAWMTYLPGALQVPLSSPMAGAVVFVAVGSSLSDGGGVEPLSKRACPWSFLLASTWYVCGVVPWHAVSASSVLDPGF
jgi:hypothetical protein